jgi:hypothetical protein
MSQIPPIILLIAVIGTLKDEIAVRIVGTFSEQKVHHSVTGSPMLNKQDKTPRKHHITHNNQMTFEPVLQPRSVTMCPRIDSYKSVRWSLST